MAGILMKRGTDCVNKVIVQGNTSTEALNKLVAVWQAQDSGLVITIHNETDPAFMNETVVVL